MCVSHQDPEANLVIRLRNSRVSSLRLTRLVRTAHGKRKLRLNRKFPKQEAEFMKLIGAVVLTLFVAAVTMTQTKISGTVVCSKADKQQSMEVEDAPDHSLCE